MEKPPPCRAACPIGNDVRGAMGVVARRGLLGLSEEQALDEAWRLITATNPFPAVVERVCPHPCERHCNRGEKDEPVSVAAFERFVGDWGIDRGLDLPNRSRPSGKSVSRCLGCGACIGCERCWMYCTPGCFGRSERSSVFNPSFSLSLPMCDGCGKCADECPSGFIEMH